MILVFVAPHAGAWIETVDANTPIYGAAVAPHAGAWIETGRWWSIQGSSIVAPHAGAWIETMNSLLTC